MAPRATVVVPTHNHGPTLLRSVPSALSQTIPDLEVFLIGDGASEKTREIAVELCRSDERVRLFDHPKGPRHGEILRHGALQEARGEIVCYLSDDDLWLPDHVATMASLLLEADFAHTYPVRIEPDGTIGDWNVDLAVPWFRRAILGGSNFIPLSCGGHTLDAYRRLPHGWRTTPEGTPTDLYMWQQFLEQPWCSPASGSRPTVLHFASTDRVGWTEQARLAELDAWSTRVSDPAFRADLDAQVLDLTARGMARHWEGLEDYRSTLATTRENLGGVKEQLDTIEEHRQDLERQIRQIDDDRAEERASLEGRVAELESRLEERDQRLQAIRRELGELRATRWWRLRESLLRRPLLGRMIRSAGRARAQRGGR